MHSHTNHASKYFSQISPEGFTTVWEVQGDAVRTFRVFPQDFGLPNYPLSAMRGGDATENISLFRMLMAGGLPEARAPLRDFVLMNASVLLVLAGIESDLLKAVATCRDVLQSGRVQEVWQCYVAETQRCATSQ